MYTWYMYGLPHKVYIYISIRAQPTNRPPPDVRANGHMTGTVLCRSEALRQLVINQKMWVPQRHLEKKNEASLRRFLAFAVCSRCSNGTGCRVCEAINPITILSVSNEMSLNPLPPILNRLRLETNYELMVWSLNTTCVNTIINATFRQTASYSSWNRSTKRRVSYCIGFTTKNDQATTKTVLIQGNFTHFQYNVKSIEKEFSEKITLKIAISICLCVFVTHNSSQVLVSFSCITSKLRQGQTWIPWQRCQMLMMSSTATNILNCTRFGRKGKLYISNKESIVFDWLAGFASHVRSA